MTSKALDPRSASVLIVDQSAENREILRTILESRGVNILEAQQGAEGLALLDKQHPSLVVLDLEVDDGDPTALQVAYEAASRREETPLVLLGRVKAAHHSHSDSPAAAARHVLEKPYHYAPLIRTIEQLLRLHQAAA